ncbi:SufE family protein [Pararhizobium haloflavum]|uniref:SufE family protein n=1 Tax=Pararhizobium haloflavum TaxID=2037914 RepID=UPI000C18D600|nr:SufE family protein [Pararhizobium haloflavum]
MTPLQQIKDDFAFLDDWEDRYRYVIELGRELEPLSDGEQNDRNKVQGCTSQVWLVHDAVGSGSDPVLTFRGDSDAHIVRGLVAIALSAFSGRRASEIQAFDAVGLFNELGLVEHLSPQRANGLRAMVGRIKQDAGTALESADGEAAQRRA